jgi:hypothetical protein
MGRKLNNPIIPPTGQRYLQNGRLITMLKSAITENPTMVVAFTLDDVADEASNKSTELTTIRKSITKYFKYRKYLSPLKERIFFGKGILFIKS